MKIDGFFGDMLNLLICAAFCFDIYFIYLRVKFIKKGMKFFDRIEREQTYQSLNTQEEKKNG